MKVFICLAAILAVAVLGLGAAGMALNHHPSDASVQATDDAYVQADLTRVAPRLSGVIASVDVESYQAVKAGDLLFTLDERDLNNNIAMTAMRAMRPRRTN